MNLFKVVIPENRVSKHLIANLASGWHLWCMFEFVVSDSIVTAVGFISTNHAVVQALIFPDDIMNI